MTEPNQFPPSGSEQKHAPAPDLWAQAATDTGAKKTDAQAPGWERSVLEKLAQFKELVKSAVVDRAHRKEPER